MEHAQPIRPEDLLEHLSWAKALARRLVSDDATADDVVQESMVAALRHPPRAGRPVRPWLSRVLDNAARQRARGERRRASRERASSQAEALPSASELTGRAEAQRALIDALLTLDEPSREVVLLRYFEDLSSAEIARRTGQPAGTVRSRLKRALDGLREKLDDRFDGDRGGWHAVLAPLTLPRAAAPASAAAGLLVFGGLLLKGAVALGAVAVVTLAVVFLGEVLGPHAPVPVEEVAFVPIEESALPAAQAPSAPDTRRQPSASAIEPVPRDVAEFVAGYGEVTLRLVDDLGRPVAGVEAGIVGRSTVSRGAAVRRRVTDVSGADGRVTLDVWFGAERAEGRVRVHRAGIASDVVAAPGAPGERTDLGDVELHFGGDISGLVVDEKGRPLEGLRVFVEGREQRVSTGGGMQRVTITDLGAAEDRSDGEGRFRLTGVHVGDVRVQVESDDQLREGRSGRVEVRAGQESTGLVVVADEIDPLTRIEGIVLDAAGEPVAYAHVNARWKTFFASGSSSRSTDRAGRFRILVRARAKADLEFRAPGSGTARARLEGVRGGTHDVEARLVEPARLAVALTGADGAPMTRARIYTETGDGRVGGLQTSKDGRFEVVAPDRAFRVVVDADGHAEASSAQLNPRDLSQTVTLALTAMPTLRGTVLANGEAIEGAALSVRSLATQTVRVAELPSLVDPTPVARSRTASDGTFSLTLRKAGRYVLRAEHDGSAPVEFGPFEYSPEVGLDDVALELTAGGSIEGVVLDGDGLRQSHVVLVSRGDGAVRTVRTDLDGAFRFEHLTPGPWMMRVVPKLMDPDGGGMTGSWGRPYREIDGDCVVVEGQATRHDLAVGQLEARARVRGRLIFDGFDASQMAVDLVPMGENRSTWRSPGFLRVESNGAFAVSGGAPGAHMLVLFDSAERDESDALRFAVELDLTAGDNPFELEVSFGAIRVGPDADRQGERLLWRGPAGVFAVAPFPPPGEARSFPAGTVQRVRFEAIAMGDIDAAEVLDEVRLRPGETIVVGE